MNKVIIIVIGVAVIAGAIFAFKSFYNPPVVPEPAPTTSSQISPTPTPTPAPKPTTVKPPATSSSVLDRIEAAIRAKLKR